MLLQDTLHILNGQAMYDYFKETAFLELDMMIPFNEAMCYGNTVNDIFSNEFVEVRAKVHHVSPEQYAEFMLKTMQTLLSKNSTRINLWFDADMFCQINLLTILAWLDQAEHKSSITLHIVGDKFEPLENYILDVSGYYDIYKQVLIQKMMPTYISPVPLKKGVELYLNYLKQDSDLMLYIEEHKKVSDKELMLLLLKNFRDHGLGDRQYLEIIQNYRKRNQY